MNRVHEPPRSDDVAVVIPCHNYGRYLEACLLSVFAQTHPAAEVWIVDDSSHDETQAVAESFLARGVRLHRITARDVFLARRAGYERTTSPFLCFLDADDYLDHNYLAASLQAFADPLVGIVTSDLHLCGTTKGIKRHTPCPIEHQNWLHAGSLVRRVALEHADAFRLPGSVQNSHADWFVWRRVLRAGWRAVRGDGIYHYRQHPASMMHQRDWPRQTYYQFASLQHETVTLILPLSGRRTWWPRLREWVERQTWPAQQLDIVVTDTGDDQFSAEVRQWLATVPARSTSYIRLAPTAGLADADRKTDLQVRQDVARVVPQLYRHAIAAAANEWLVIMEDDILPPDDAIERLLRGIDEKTAAVSGAYRSRYAERWTVHPPRTKPGSGRELVERTGFGCLLLRRSVVQQTILHHGPPTTWYDWNFGIWCQEHGWRIVMDWDLRCAHQDLPGD